MMMKLMKPQTVGRVSIQQLVNISQIIFSTQMWWVLKNPCILTGGAYDKRCRQGMRKDDSIYG